MNLFSTSNKGILSRALLAKLVMGATVYPHIDIGAYYVCRDRYHLVIQSSGSLMTINGIEYEWKEGELWKFNNKAIHSAKNNKPLDRIHLIFDILPTENIEWLIKLAEEYNILDYGKNPLKGINVY